MATKKSPSRSKPANGKSALQNLAARPANFDDTLDDQIVDASGVFRVTSAIAQAQTGHDEDQGMRFPQDPLGVGASHDGFDDGPTLDEGVDETAIEAEAQDAMRRQRLATLAARHAILRKRR